MEKNIETILSEMVASYGVSGTFNESTAIADLGLDSIDAADFMFKIEEEFNFLFGDDALESVNTVGDLVAKIKELSGKK